MSKGKKIFRRKLDTNVKLSNFEKNNYKFLFNHFQVTKNYRTIVAMKVGTKLKYLTNYEQLRSNANMYRFTKLVPT